MPKPKMHILITLPRVSIARGIIFYIGGVDVDQLQQCAQVFADMLNKDYYLTLEDGAVLHIYFKRYHFKHLLGLHKLIDVPATQATAGKAELVFKRVMRGELTMKDIRRSKHYQKIKDRIQLFPMIESVFSKRVIVDFNPALLDNCKLNAEYILYTQFRNGYLHLAIGHDVHGQYPESFFFDSTPYYLSEQHFMNVVKLEVVQKTKKRKRD